MKLFLFLNVIEYAGMENLSLSSHFTFKNMFKQCWSPVLMLLFTSIYGIVDGIFIANFDGPNAFAGVNLIFPIIMIVGGLGFMFGSGGSALAGKLLGEKNRDDACRVFTMMIMVGFALGCIVAAIFFSFVDEITKALADLSQDSTPEMIDKAILYGRILICGQPLFITQNLFQNFFVVDEKPNYGFRFTLAAGLTNMVFDALFIAAFKWGVAGAAAATIMGYAVGSAGPIVYFMFHQNDVITLKKTNIDLKKVGKCCFNGLSDFIFNISASIVGIVYNIQLLKYIGQDGVAAQGVVMYVSFICISIFIGISIGMAPIISYNYGAKNHEELKNVVVKLLMVIAAISTIMAVVGAGLSYPLACLFSREEDLIEMSTKAMTLYSISYIFSGFCILFVSMFTALNDGLVSGLISLFRSLISQIVFVFILPIFFGADGIWVSIIISELTSFIFALIFYFANRKKYHY